jgi:hypothetical protein
MTPSTAPFSSFAAELAAAKARHPASRRRDHRHDRPLCFAETVALLTGPWRVNDPAGFATAMTESATLGGHPVVDLATFEGEALAPVVAGIGPRRRLGLWWVAGSAAGQLHVEARAEAPAGREGPEIFVLAHLVEPLGAGLAPADHSWVVIVAGDGSGGVATVARSTLACPRRPRCCPLPAADVRFPLAALKARLLSPALEAEAASSPPPAAVIPLPSRA